ncbi:MAG TPA: sigma-70 family RNA polymerase sigma factor [Bryobacteraceae bacterium]
MPAKEVTQLLRDWSRGDKTALDRLTPIVYEELRRIARIHMTREDANHTLQSTALVNEAYLRLFDCARMQWRDRAHFFAMSSQLMRRILIDHARRRNIKRGGGLKRVTLAAVAGIGVEHETDLIALDDALNALAEIDKRKSDIVEMRFFGGLSVEETAEALGISPITVIRDWNTAKAWLYRELSRGSEK